MSVVMGFILNKAISLSLSLGFSLWFFLIRVFEMTAISHSFDAVRTTTPTTKLVVKKSSVGVLAFEIAGLMSKLLHLWQSLSDKSIIRVRNDAISLEGVRKIVSNDEAFLLGLACAEMQKVIDLEQKIFWQRQEVKYLKDRSLWNRSFDTVTSMLARSIFTVLARIKLVFGIGHGYPASLPRSLSASATVHPSENPSSCNFVSGPLKSPRLEEKKDHHAHTFFDLNSKLLKPPPTTLGATALALHYANLIIVIEKMIKSPQLVGVDARDDVYGMLPDSIRSSLRARLKGVGFSASDPVLAGEWKDALGRILAWLSPLAHNMIKWQSERSFEQQNLVQKTNVLLLQTLYFANKEKTEAAITELLVGLNYIWRFEREMNAKALFECSNINGSLSNLQNSS
ncbi:unnamed protein product, partial [Vitis vinifera]